MSAVCIHFDAQRKNRCELQSSRKAVQDCQTCAAYEPDVGYQSRSTEEERIRDDVWLALLME